jgi:hypothetical protein
MGNCVFKDIHNSKDNLDDLLSKNCYEKQYIVGRGGFGRVWKV